MEQISATVCEIILVESESMDSWSSAQVLKEDFKSFYTKRFPDLKVLSLKNIYKVESEEKNILKQLDAKYIVIIDHRIMPNLLLPFIKSAKLWVHIWGSLIPRIKHFQDQMPLNELGFIVGSQAQEKALFLILKSKNLIQYLPFQGRDFSAPHFQSQNTVEPTYIYVGRISNTKNVTHLLNLFHRFYQRKRVGKLIIAGLPDNVNLFSHPPRYLVGFAGENFFHTLDQLQKEGTPIEYRGFQNKEEVKKIYQEATHYISLSTAEEEDFGLSVWDAVSHGLSCVLTKWGGHREFDGILGVKLLDVTHVDETLAINESLFQSYLQEYQSKESVFQSFLNWKNKRDQKRNHFSLEGIPREMTQNTELQHFNKDYFFNEYQRYLLPYWE